MRNWRFSACILMVLAIPVAIGFLLDCSGRAQAQPTDFVPTSISSLYTRDFLMNAEEENFQIISHDGFDFHMDNDNDSSGAYIIRDGSDTTIFSLPESGVLSILAGYDGIGAISIPYGSADITDHTFTTDGTGDSEIVLPDDSIGQDEIDLSGASSLFSFKTMNAPTGTDPVADAVDDTLNFTAGNSITVTGTAGTDTLDFAVTDDSIDGAQLADTVSLDAAFVLDGQTNDITLTVDGGSGEDITLINVADDVSILLEDGSSISMGDDANALFSLSQTTGLTFNDKTPTANQIFLELKNNGSGVFSVDEDGDTVTTGLATISNTAPQLTLADTTASASDGFIRVDTNMMFLQSSLATNGDLGTFDLVNDRFGLGTAAPSVEFHVFKSSGNTTQTIETDAAGACIINFDGVQTGNSLVSQLAFFNAGDSVGAIGLRRSGANDAGDMEFFTQATGGGNTERVVITSDGELLLGTAVTPAGYATNHVTDISDAKLTAAGVWTDAPSILAYKLGVHIVPATGTYELQGISDRVPPEKRIRRGAWTVLDDISIIDFEYRAQELRYVLNDDRILNATDAWLEVKGKIFTEVDGATRPMELSDITKRIFNVRVNRGSGETHRGVVLDTIPPEIADTSGIAVIDLAANNTAVMQEAKRRILRLEAVVADLVNRIEILEKR